jgi:hypothetical protein
MKCSGLNNSSKNLTIYCQIKCEHQEEYSTTTVTAAPGQDHVFTVRIGLNVHFICCWIAIGFNGCT